MDPITLIVTALAAGAALGVQDTASAMVKDAYASLKALARKRLGGDPGAELVLSRHEQGPEIWQAPLMAELARAGADGDGDLIAAAKALLDLAGGAGGRKIYGRRARSAGRSGRGPQPARQRVQDPGRRRWSAVNWGLAGGSGTAACECVGFVSGVLLTAQGRGGR